MYKIEKKNMTDKESPACPLFYPYTEALNFNVKITKYIKDK